MSQQELIRASRVSIAGPDGEPRSRPETHHFSFCKTHRLPYDEVVAASLLTLKHHHGAKIEINSVGCQLEVE